MDGSVKGKAAELMPLAQCYEKTESQMSTVQRPKVWYVCTVHKDLLQVVKDMELIEASRVGRIQKWQAQKKQYSQSSNDTWSVPVKPSAPEYDV